MADSILVVDDDVALAKVLCALLAQAKYKASTVADATAALAVLEKGGVDLVLTDVRMPGMDGFGLLKTIREKWPETPVVMMTAHGSVPMAVDAMRQGAADFLTKPFENENMKHVVGKVLASSKPERESVPSAASKKGSGLFGNTAAMLEAKSLIERLAASNSTALLRGENGTGKEVAAREIHRLSKRANGPFIAVNCGAVPAELIESELFGHEKGAFTGATTAKPGRVELAEGGTLFLDEIGDMPMPMQVKLLRVLQEGTFERVGGGRTIKVDVRVVAATNRDLAAMVQDGSFREDLFYRLNVVTLRVPPLRERKEDIPALVAAFTAQGRKGHGIRFADDGLRALANYDFPGNVRELENLVERMAILYPNETISAASVAEMLNTAPAKKREGGAARSALYEEGRSLRDLLHDLEKQIMVEAIAANGNSKGAAAQALSSERSHFYKKCRQFGIGGEDT
ncbi:MAG TPA: sigma-54 dependent transcriptional regulator [Polyangiales bacterium]|nr:sigma-54 dependent transcriptional regulator [Polyangiales bacterium]